MSEEQSRAGKSLNDAGARQQDTISGSTREVAFDGCRFRAVGRSSREVGKRAAREGGRLNCELPRAFGPEPGVLCGIGDFHQGGGSERVAGSVCLRSDFIEMPD